MKSITFFGKYYAFAEMGLRVGLGLLPRCVDPRYMPKADPVEDRGFFDRAGGEGFVLALKNSEDCGVY